MSKPKIPTLPPNSSRSAIVVFRDQVRTYARKEFERGATPEEVYERVAANGQLWALRNSIDAEYYDFLGIQRGKARVGALLAAMSCYFVLSGFAPVNNPIFRYAVPVLIAMSIARWVEVRITASMRKQFERAKQPAMPSAER